MSEIKKIVDGFDEKYEHPLSGYNNSYDYLKVEGEIVELTNGKFRANITETVYHGDEEDEGLEYECDIQDQGKYSSPEFDTLEQAYKWTEDPENVACEYEG
jgi:hypothetical protein